MCYRIYRRSNSFLVYIEHADPQEYNYCHQLLSVKHRLTDCFSYNQIRHQDCNVIVILKTSWFIFPAKVWQNSLKRSICVINCDHKIWNMKPRKNNVKLCAYYQCLSACLWNFIEICTQCTIIQTPIVFFGVLLYFIHVYYFCVYLLLVTACSCVLL